MENNSEYYLSKLKTSDNPGRILAEMYCSLYNLQVSKSEVMMCNRMVKTFGRNNTFFSILAMYGTYPEGTEEPSALLYKICLRRFESAYDDSTIQARTSLVPYVNKIQEEIERISKQKAKEPPSPEGLNKDV